MCDSISMVRNRLSTAAEKHVYYGAMNCNRTDGATESCLNMLEGPKRVGKVSPSMTCSRPWDCLRHAPIHVEELQPIGIVLAFEQPRLCQEKQLEN